MADRSRQYKLIINRIKQKGLNPTISFNDLSSQQKRSRVLSQRLLMGPQNSTPNSQHLPTGGNKPKQGTATNNTFHESSGFTFGSRDGSLSNSFIQGDGFYRNNEGAGPSGAGSSQDRYNVIDSNGRNSNKAETSQGQQQGWSQLSRQQQRIYHGWHKAHQRQLQSKRKRELKARQEQEAQKAASVSQQEENNYQAAVQKRQQQDQQQTKEQEEPAGESIWRGLQRRLAFTQRASEEKSAEQPENESSEEIEVALTIQVNESESLRVPLDLTEHESLSTFTSNWLKEVIFKVVREKRLATRSASHSKSSTDVPGSEDGLSNPPVQNSKHQNMPILEPVCLSTVYNETECIDFLLTQPMQIVSTYLPMDSILKVNYVSEEEMDEEKNTKQVPSLRSFDFIKVLGTGGFATVYMVRKRTTGMLYAMKLVKKDGVKQDQVKFAQVYTERQILEQLKNPFLVQLHYAFVTTNYYCLVIDLCTGGELFYYLQKNQSFHFDNARLLFAEVVLAVEFLHSHDILYRDLKPENVLVDERGHLRLTDFGLCRSNFKQRRDRAMSFVGSPEYMSPEILLGSGYDYSVDYYTLGVLLYEMLVGLPPHYNEDKMQMYKDITMKESVIPRVLPEDARDILDHLLQIQPENRLGMGPDGIQEIKRHAFFREIDWDAISQKAPQPGRKRLPLEVNILESNFDRQYTRLPIRIDVAQEELIKINDPIELTRKVRTFSKSFTYKPQYNRRRARKSMLNKKAEYKRKLLHREASMHAKRLDSNFVDIKSLPKTLTQISKTRSQHFKRPCNQFLTQQQIKEVDSDREELNDVNIPTKNKALVYIRESDTHELLPNGSSIRLQMEQQRTLLRQSQSNQMISGTASTQKLSLATHINQPNLDKRIEPFIPIFNSTVELQSLQNASKADTKNSYSHVDVFTEISLATEENDALRRSMQAGKRPTQGQLISQLSKNALKKLRQREAPYREALSPISQLDIHQNGSGPSITKHHGYSEYNRRDIPGRPVNAEHNQDSAFNYRKQTMGDEELDQHSCSEVDLMNMRGDQNLLTGSNVDLDMLAMQSTPSKGPNKFTTPTILTSDAAGPSELTPQNFIDTQYHINLGVNLAQPKLQTNNSLTGRAMMERVAEELVLEEETGEYLLKAMPTSITTAGIGLSAAGKTEPMQAHMLQIVSDFGDQEKIDEDSDAYIPMPVNTSMNYQAASHSVKIEVDICSPDQQPGTGTNQSSFHAYASFFGPVEKANMQGIGITSPIDHSQPLISEEYSSSASSEMNDQESRESFASLDYASVGEGHCGSKTGQYAQIEPCKIQAMHKSKSKKQKKRLSQRQNLEQSAQFIMNEMQEGGNNQRDVLAYQYGFSVEQQKQRPITREQSLRFRGSLREVAKHQSSHNISHLLAQSAMGVTPRAFSKVPSLERLPNLPTSKPIIQPSQKRGGAMSSLQHSKMIKFTEKAAGVVSERYRKFSKPQTLKNLQQKMLQADDDDDFDQIEDESIMEGSGQVQMHRLELPLDQHNADQQLNFSSQMISVGDFESRADDEPQEPLRFVEESHPSSNFSVTVPNEGNADDASPVLQFESQSMAEISLPRDIQDKNSQPIPIIRESASSPALHTKKTRNQHLYNNMNPKHVIISKNKKNPQSLTIDKPHCDKNIGSISPMLGFDKPVAGENLFRSQARILVKAKQSDTQQSAGMNCQNNSNLNDSPLLPRGEINRSRIKDLIPYSPRLADPPKIQNTSLHFQDLMSGSKKKSMIGKDISPYGGGLTSTKKKGKVKLVKGMQSSKASSSRIILDSASAIASSSRAGSRQGCRMNNKQQQSQSKTGTFISTGKKTKPHQQLKSIQKLVNPSSTDEYCQKPAQSSSKVSNKVKISVKNNQGPPRQPILIQSPLEKCEQISISLRVLKTPFGLKNAPQNLKGSALSIEDQNNHNDDVKSQRNDRSFKDRILVRDSYHDPNMRLATVSSRRSFLSQGKSPNTKKSKMSALDKRAHSQWGATRYQNYPTFSPKKQKETAYVEWKEVPLQAPQPEVDELEITPSSQLQIKDEETKDNSNNSKNKTAKILQIIRMNSGLHIQRRSSHNNNHNINSVIIGPSELRSGPKQNSNQQKPQLQPKKEIQAAKQNILEVVDDIMSSLGNSKKNAAYGTKQSPEQYIFNNKNGQRNSSGILRGQSLFESPIQRKGIHMMRNYPTFEKLSQSSDHQKKLTLADALMKHPKEAVKMMKRQVIPFEQPDRNLETEDLKQNQEKQKKNYNLQLVPLDPTDSTQMLPTYVDMDDEDESQNKIHQSVSQNTLHIPSEQRLETSNIMNQSEQLTPRALMINKQKTPFKSKLLKQGHIETSVEVLNMDGSEFTESDNITRSNNLVTLRSEEILSGDTYIQMLQQSQLNSTFNYIVSGGEVGQNNGTQSSKIGERNARVLSADGIQVLKTYNEQENYQQLQQDFIQQQQQLNVLGTEAIHEDMQSCQIQKSILFDKDSPQAAIEASAELRRHSMAIHTKSKQLCSAMSIASLARQTDSQRILHLPAASSITKSQHPNNSGVKMLFSKLDRDFDDATTRKSVKNQMPIAKHPNQDQPIQSQKSPTSSFISMLGIQIPASTTSSGQQYFSNPSLQNNQKELQVQLQPQSMIYQKPGAGAPAQLQKKDLTQTNLQRQQNIKKSKKNRQPKKRKTFNNSASNTSITEQLQPYNMNFKTVASQVTTDQPSTLSLGNQNQALSSHRMVTQSAMSGKKSAGKNVTNNFTSVATGGVKIQHRKSIGNHSQQSLKNHNYARLNLKPQSPSQNPEQKSQNSQLQHRMYVTSTSNKKRLTGNIFAKKVSLDLTAGNPTIAANKQSSGPGSTGPNSQSQIKMANKSLFINPVKYKNSDNRSASSMKNFSSVKNIVQLQSSNSTPKAQQQQYQYQVSSSGFGGSERSSYQPTPKAATDHHLTSGNYSIPHRSKFTTASQKSTISNLLKR